MVSLAAAEEAIELADAYGVADGHPLSESQKITLRAAGGERSDGMWAATRVGDFGPRQGTGKNDKIAAWELAHLILFGTKLIIHTAHEFPTANESFLRLVAVFENYDDLRRRVARVRYANGEQGVELLSGQRLKYRARTGGSGRGFAKAGLLVYDEAQHLGREHIAASGPSKFANANAQTWYAGSGGLASSAVAWNIRRAALSGDGGRLAYTEMTAEDVSLVNGSVVSKVPDDLRDRDLWYRTIPGLGRWVTEEGAEALVEELGDLFPREILCVWEPEPGTTDGPIPLDRWSDLIDADAEPVPASVRLSLDCPPDRTSASFAVAGKLANGLLYVERRDHLPPERMGQLVARAAELSDGHGVPLIVPPGSPALAWKAELLAAGVELDEMTPAEYAAACGYISAAIAEGKIRHRGQPELTNAVAGLATRTTGDVEVWARRTSSVNIAPFVAATCALARVPDRAKQEALTGSLMA